jgi:phospholipase C
MDQPTRREALKFAAAMAGMAASSALSDSIRRAAAIAPEPGSTFLDAQHVVILMQENRSFDHAYGTLRGVRGFDDPRAITLPNGRPVWVQSNARGESYVPFRLNLKDSKSTWMGCLPHSWTDQVDARHGGLHDRWLDAKPSGEAEYAHLPLTMGYYDRQDIPFYYELADAFTICDQNFCSVLSATTPNRCYLWTGTIRSAAKDGGRVHLHNHEIDLGAEVSWSTFPERLEDHGISWKVYQNEIYADVGFQDEEGPWLSNFGDNPLEYFTQYHPHLAVARRRHLKALVQSLRRELSDLEAKVSTQHGTVDVRLKAHIAKKKRELDKAIVEQERSSDAAFEQLSPRARSLHEKAFCTNAGDPDYHQLTSLTYSENGVQRRVQVPKGDLFHQFRKDVENDALPAVSWLSAPERLSDHPGSAWYGAWYIAETINILIQNPEVWKKTILILTYDENDGYFDHVPPFTAPHPTRPGSGVVSASLDAAVEYVEATPEEVRRSPGEVRDSPIGLGYRVPLVIASPWTRGGYVCSQVFDHTSPIQFLEKWLSRRTGREIREENISAWRRAVCGDLTAAFRSEPEAAPDMHIPRRDEYVELIHRAKFKSLPATGAPLSTAELAKLELDSTRSALLPRQEPGQRPSCALPYDLAVNGALSEDGRRFTISFAARNEHFGKRAAGSPFIVYSRLKPGEVRVRNYAVAAGDEIEDSWLLADFADGRYDLAVYGPNGFFRHFRGAGNSAAVGVQVDRRLPADISPAGPTELVVGLTNGDARREILVAIEDTGYGGTPLQRTIPPNQRMMAAINVSSSHGWYDLRIIAEDDLNWRFAGRLETGVAGWSDPVIGRQADLT